MKIVVVGGSGFIGSHLVDKLINDNHHVIIYDVDMPRYEQDCEFIRGDARDLQRLLISTRKIDAIYHLAAEANVNRFYESPIFSNDITAVSTLNVLECAKVNEISRVLLASTEWIYGSGEGNEEQIIDEEAPYSQNPDHIYTSSKICAELFCKNYFQLYNVNYTIMRYGIPFGERARPATVTPIFMNKIINNEEILIHGDGSQTRQFIYVKDLAQGNVACLKKEAENQIFNLNGKQKISVLDIVQTLETILSKKAKIKLSEQRKGNFQGRYISSEKAKSILGWEAEMNYMEAMRKYVSDYNKNSNKN